MSQWELGELQHLSRSADHLGSLANVLKDLGGDETILHELTQNADDASEATTVRFSVETDSLIVWNDGVFTNCGHQREKHCPWKEEQDRSCDLHSFRLFSGRHKSGDASTTGAFGVGFTCVYHLTDHPELITSGTHLVLDEGASESQRIRVCRDASCPRDHDAPGTTFVLPWAREQSALRQLLEVETVDDARVARLDTAFRADASATLLFLKRIMTIEIRSCSGNFVAERTADDDIVHIRAGELLEDWLLLENEYDTSDHLKRRFRDIEANRSGLVQVAIRVGPSAPGRFYAGLPTQMPTGWGGHVNGTFYPRTDRKSLEFADGTYRSEWNLDLLDSAAHLVAENLERIAEAVGLLHVWEILRDLQRVARDVGDGGLPRGFERVFAKVAAAANHAEILQVADGSVRRPSRAVLPVEVDHYRGAMIMQSLGLPVVHPDLRSIVFETEYTRYGIGQLTAGRLIEHLVEDAQLTEPWESGSGVLADPDVDLLLELLELLLDRSKSWIEEPETSRIAILPCAGSRYAAAEHAVRIEDEALRRFFTKADPELEVADAERTSSRSSTMLGLVRELDLESGLGAMSKPGAAGLFEEYAEHLIRWLERHQSSLEASEEAQAQVRRLAIFPRSGGGRDALTRLSVPSDFEDLFGVADLLEADFVQHHWPLLSAAGAEELTAVEYLTKHIIPRVDELTTDPRDLEFALDLAYSARRELDGAPWAVELLRDAPLIMCTDGIARRGAEVHMPNAVVSLIDPDAPIADVNAVSEYLHDTIVWLGASTGPSRALVNEAARRLAEAPEDPDPAVCSAILEAISDASEESPSVPIDLANLRDLPWLPIEGGGRGRPAEVYPIFQSYLFESQGPKLALDRITQYGQADALYWLGMPKEPTSPMVVEHLRHCASSGEAMNNEVYVWLGRELGEPALAALSNEAIIQISQGNFVHPRQAFWQPSQLGRWASELPHEMRRYQTFLDALGVTETPTAADLNFILKLIAEAVGTNQLEEEDELVVRECWAMLDLLLHSDPTTTRTLQLIGRRPSYPDRRQVLARPERLIFRDPRRLVDRIPLLVNEVIDRERRNQRALEAAGVTRAEDVIDVQPVDVVSQTDSAMMRVLLDRRVPLMRAIDSVAAAREDLDFDPERLVALDVHAASTLNVVYRATVGSQHFATPPQPIDAMYFDDTYRVVHTRSLNKIPVAREISRAVAPYLDPSELAPLIVSVLDADSVEDAMQRLDDYGVALVVDIARETIASSVAVDVLEGKAGDNSALNEGAWHGSVLDTFEDGFDEAEGVLDGEAEPDWIGDLRDQAADGATGEPVSNVESEVASDDDLSTGASRRTSRSHEREGALGGGLGTGKSRRGGSGSATRMRSYVLFGDESDYGTTGDESQETHEIDRAGVARVLAYERSCGRTPEEQDHGNPGFDVLSHGRNGAVARRIEVKSIGGEWTARGVMLSSRQFREANEHTEQFWLYVVENALDDDLYRIHRIQDPATRVDYFAFDDGWAALAEADLVRDERGLPTVTSTRGLLGRSPGQSDS